MYLSDLPTGALAHVSSFLPAPSRALFAVALNSRDSSSAIVGNQWDALDFGEIEKELAAKISDDDIRDALLSIDAVNNLKKLRLTNCVHVTGAGLKPLRGSTIIEQIDLSLVGDHKSPRLDPEPLISCTHVLPILDSIIERGEDCSLKHLMLPNEWRKERNTESDFHAFLTRYNELLCSREGRCLECRCNLSNRNRDDLHMLNMSAEDGKFYGTQKYTCYDCTKQYCEDCEDDGVGIVLTALISENAFNVTRILALTVSPDQVAAILAVPTKSGVFPVLKMKMLSASAKVVMKSTASIVATPMCML
eukprot:scaffold14195_cov155-Skeletonema_dohrnii-CCMP3373.AAC.3